MIKASTLLFLHAETSLHPGSGEALGAIDLAVQRERFTGFPTIAGQGLKGPARRVFPEGNRALHRSLFGPATDENPSDHAGAAAFSDARLLLFPVRSLRGVFAWVTCPLALARLRLDLARADNAPAFMWDLSQLEPEPDQVLGAHSNDAGHACKLATGDQVVLEEQLLTFTPEPGVGTLAVWLTNHAFPDAPEYAFFKGWLSSHLLVLTDDDFAHFVHHATEVQARIALNEQKTTTGGVGNLFYQENLPPETVLYAVVGMQDDLSGLLNGQSSAPDLLEELKTGLTGTDASGYLQVGGDESVGKGVVRLSFLHEQADEN